MRLRIAFLFYRPRLWLATLLYFLGALADPRMTRKQKLDAFRMSLKLLRSKLRRQRARNKGA